MVMRHFTKDSMTLFASNFNGLHLNLTGETTKNTSIKYKNKSYEFI